MNGVRTVMLRGLEEQRVIFVQRGLDGLRQAWFGRLMQWRTSIALQSMTWKRREEWAGAGVPNLCGRAREEGRERLEGIVVVIAFAFAVQVSPSNASSPISPHVGAPRGLAVFLRPPRLYPPYIFSG